MFLLATIATFNHGNAMTIWNPAVPKLSIRFACTAYRFIEFGTNSVFRIFPLINFFFSAVFVCVQDLFYKVVGYPEQVLQGELALVTGGGGGLGRLLALRLSKLGVDIVIWDINQEGMYCIFKFIQFLFL